MTGTRPFRSCTVTGVVWPQARPRGLGGWDRNATAPIGAVPSWAGLGRSHEAGHAPSMRRPRARCSQGGNQAGQTGDQGGKSGQRRPVQRDHVRLLYNDHASLFTMRSCRTAFSPTLLPNLFALCSHGRMVHVSPESVSAAIRSAPAFARLGLSMRMPAIASVLLRRWRSP